ncbi:hypothetical protein Vadar_013377 [Vaccinium darrowii]|uniref:Uncharacterized protein n=1 Tax=Vaccinium darrowii TaxID=229202 RepID=A0ACB7YM08_9ERIC|nr:hypothetical protein Vadar_013377 [Vaccinium darrowii]
MDSQIPRPGGLDQNQPTGMEGQEDHQPGKRSVFMNKVKAKARKIKDALTKKDDNADHDNNDETVEGHEEEDEMVVDSEVHESVPGKNPSGNLEKPTVAAENRYDSKYQDPQTRQFSQGQDEDIGKYGGSTGSSTLMGVADVHVPEKPDDSFSPSAGTFGTPGSESAGNFVHGEVAGHTGQRPKISMETPTCMEEDPPKPKDGPEASNYLSKIDDPTGAGGEEAGITGMRHSFDKMNVYDKPESKPKSEQAPELYTESQDQFSPEPIPPQSTINANDTEDVPVDNVTKLPSNQSGYTSAIADKAIAAKNAVAWTLGYGANQDETASLGTLYTQKQEGEGKEGEKQKPVAIVTEFEEASELLGSDEDPKREMTETEYKTGCEDAGITGMPDSFNKMNVYDEPESKPKSEEAPELYTDSQDKFSQEPIPPQSTINPNDTEDVPLDNVAKLPSNQSGYTFPIADKAIAAKNVVASKLGYGGNQDETAASDTLDTRKQEGEGEEGENQKPMGIVTESEEVRERLGSDDPNGEMTETESKIGSSVKDTLFTRKQEEEGEKGENQKPAGIVTESGEVRERLGSDEDPSKEKTETESKIDSSVKDTLYARKQEEEGEKGENQKPVGIVTEPEEVRERLGSDEDPNREKTETESKAASNVSPTGKGYVESVKDSVTSWWSGGGAQKQDSEASPGKTHGEGERLSSSTGEAAAAAGDGDKGVGERRLQE